MLEQDILADRKARDEIALLMHGADRGGERLTRGSELRRQAVKHEPPGIGLIDPGHDLDERGLSRAVFAHQRMDLASPYLERHIIERPDAREVFGHVIDGEVHAAASPIVSGAHASG